jgi:hypothetical protein
MPPSENDTPFSISSPLRPDLQTAHLWEPAFKIDARAHDEARACSGFRQASRLVKSYESVGRRGSLPAVHLVLARVMGGAVKPKINPLLLSLNEINIGQRRCFDIVTGVSQ